MKERILDTYKISIGPIGQSLETFLKNKDYSKIVLINDLNTHKYCTELISDQVGNVDVITITPGEQFKNIKTCEKIWNQMIQSQIDRHALVVNLGGGVIGDMGGFCAATFKRGVDFIQIPTTLLAQVDASVGGKLGVDMNGIKNIVGIFKDPKAVLIDPVFLKTLPIEQIKSGYAEILKHGLIANPDLWKDSKVFDFEMIDWVDIIDRSVAVKEEVVKQDPFEKDLRKILNFGHTIGHAIETYYLDSPNHLLHGEAIAIGMICESYIASKVTGLPQKALEEIKTNLIAIYGRNQLADLSIDEINQLMLNDKKNKSGRINFSLPNQIGSCKWDQTCSVEMVKNSFEFYLAN